MEEREMMCMDCMWSGPESEMSTLKKYRQKGTWSYCPECGSDHVDYIERIKRSPVNVKA